MIICSISVDEELPLILIAAQYKAQQQIWHIQTPFEHFSLMPREVS